MFPWQCCLDGVVLIVLSWQSCLDSVVLTILPWQCCLECVALTGFSLQMSLTILPRQYCYPNKFSCGNTVAVDGRGKTSNRKSGQSFSLHFPGVFFSGPMAPGELKLIIKQYWSRNFHSILDYSRTLSAIRCQFYSRTILFLLSRDESFLAESSFPIASSCSFTSSFSSTSFPTTTQLFTFFPFWEHVFLSSCPVYPPGFFNFLFIWNQLESAAAGLAKGVVMDA